MTDTRQQDTQKAAGELQGCTHRRQDGSSHGDTAGDTRQPRNTQQTGGSEDKQREGRKGGTRMALRLGGAVEEGNEEETRQQTGSRERADRQKKVCNIFKGEKREKTPMGLAKACMCVCIYILLNIVACGLFIALSFIYIY